MHFHFPRASVVESRRQRASYNGAQTSSAQTFPLSATHMKTSHSLPRNLSGLSDPQYHCGPSIYDDDASYASFGANVHEDDDDDDHDDDDDDDEDDYEEPAYAEFGKTCVEQNLHIVYCTTYI